MRVKDLIDMLYVSVDVCDDYDERCYIGYESGYDLTDAGKRRFAGALDVPIYGINGFAVTIHCPTEKEAQACKELFYSIAGYCSEKNFDKWFRER